MDKNLAKFLQDIAVTAANAADSARSAVETAGKAAMEKYDEVKTQRELARERAAQEDIFAGLGRMLYAMHMGAAGEHVATEEGEKTPQQVIDALLVKAEQAQQRIDMLAEKLNAEKRGAHLPALRPWLQCGRCVLPGMRHQTAPEGVNAWNSACMRFSGILSSMPCLVGWWKCVSAQSRQEALSTAAF